MHIINVCGDYMLDVINNALRNEDYYVCLYDNFVYIYNYVEIISFNSEKIKVKLNTKKIVVKGKKLLIKKMHIHELLINGDIGSVTYE